MKDQFPNAIPNIPVGDFSQEEYDTMPLTAVVPNFEVDIERLQHHFKTIVLQHPEVHRCLDPVNRPHERFSGWSVTSLDGSMSSGWESNKGYTVDRQFSHARAQQAGYRSKYEYTVKTPICTGYLEEVVDRVADLGLVPHRVRIWNNRPGTRLGIHTDGPNNMYNVRLHIPIITNPGCVHVWYTDPETRVHFPADGRAHMFRTNINHDTFNFGTEDRFHLIFGVLDTRGIVPGFKYRGRIGPK